MRRDIVCGLGRRSRPRRPETIQRKIPSPVASVAQSLEDERKGTTAMLVDYFGAAARPHTMVLIEEVPDGGYARADEVFIVPDAYRAKD